MKRVHPHSAVDWKRLIYKATHSLNSYVGDATD